jgi:hypothetical protein
MLTSDGKAGGFACTVASMADSALRLIDRLAGAGATLVFGQPAGPGQVVGVDVNDAGTRIDRRSTQLHAAIETTKNNRLRVKRKRDEQSFAAKLR